MASWIFGLILAVIFAIIIAIYTYLAREMKMYPAIPYSRKSYKVYFWKRWNDMYDVVTMD